jgi:sec-independent protein translocase protein TatA
MPERAGRRRQEFAMRLGLPELLVILFIVILIFGASRLPELGRGIGRGIKNFKDATKEGASDKRDV